MPQKTTLILIITIIIGTHLFPPSSALARRGNPPPEGFAVTFSPNPPSRQYNYFSQSRDARIYRHEIESAHLHPGAKCLQDRRFWCAHRNLDFVLRYIPNHPRGLDLYSRLAINRNKPETALPYLNYALQYSGRDVPILIVYGIHRHRMGEFKKAAERFRQALEERPDSAEAHYHLGLSLVKLGLFKEARTQARKAYSLGYPLPGLREKLKKHGEWRSNS